MGSGEPDFATPEFIRRAAQQAIDAGATHYTAVEGILPLRQAIADDANYRFSGPARVAPTDVVVSTGSKQSLYNACMCLFGPGDEVLIPTPAWVSYYEMIGLARAQSVEVLGDPTNGFKVTAAALAAHATARTCGVMLNSPSNPTGSVYSAAELCDILALAASRGWWVISDEIYQRIAYGAPAASAFDVTMDRERLVVINGVAKAYAMTGWRIGWSVSSGAAAKMMTAFQSHTTSNAATVSQYAALAALTRRDEATMAVNTMVTEFQTRRDAGLAILRGEPRINVLAPDGAFYFFVQAPPILGTSDAGSALCTYLLDEYGLAVVPGAAFRTNDWIRVSYAAERALVEQAARHIASAFQHFAAR